MIHIAIGTKAQFIKMAPIMKRLQFENIPFNLIDLGQHSLINKDLREEFELKSPDVYLSYGKNISHLSTGLFWLTNIGFKSLSTKWIKEKIFLNQKGVCLIHGDTASTLVALYLAKRANIKVAHIEAGLRSYKYFEPFPEEIIRIIAMKFSDLLFAPSNWAFNNLKKMGLEKKTILLPANTSIESVYYSLNKNFDNSLSIKDYALITVHRMENIFSKKRLNYVIALIEKLSLKLPVIFVQHHPTINQIKKFNLEKRLNNIKNVHFFKILSHASFINLLNNSKLVITDGGSIQEESYYLNKPCLLLRKYTEREEGLGENVVLSKYDHNVIDNFLENYESFKVKKPIIDLKPSIKIVEVIKEYYDKSG